MVGAGTSANHIRVKPEPSSPSPDRALTPRAGASLQVETHIDYSHQVKLYLHGTGRAGRHTESFDIVHRKVLMLLKHNIVILK